MGRKKVGRKKAVDPVFSRSRVKVLRQRPRSDRIAKDKCNFLDFFKNDSEDEEVGNKHSTEMAIDKGKKPVEIETSKCKLKEETFDGVNGEEQDATLTISNMHGRSNAKVDKGLKVEDEGRASDKEDQAEHQMKMKMKSITVEGLEVVILSDSEDEEVGNKTNSTEMAIDKEGNKSVEIEEHNGRPSKENITEGKNLVENVTEGEVIFVKEQLGNGSSSKVVNSVLKKRGRPEEGKQDPESESIERTSEIENPENKVTEHITGEGPKEAGMKTKLGSSNAEDKGRASDEEHPKENNMSSDNEDMLVDGKDKSDEAATDNVDKHMEDVPNNGASYQEQNEATKNTEVQVKLPPVPNGVQMNLTFIIKMP